MPDFDVPAPELTLQDIVRNYLDNREAFYTTLLPRLPETVIRDRIKAAVEPLSATKELRSSLIVHSEDIIDEFLTALKTLDVLKKPSHGTALGRTIISVNEALTRAEQIEETGILLFVHLLEMHAMARDALAKEIELRKRALASLLQLHDELRYHRLSLVPPQ